MKRQIIHIDQEKCNGCGFVTIIISKLVRFHND